MTAETAPLPDHFRLPTHPAPRAAGVLQGETWRITVITSRLIRLEHDPDGRFEDRPTQVVLHRDFADEETPLFEVDDLGDRIRVTTRHVRLTYDRGAFSREGLAAELTRGFRNWGATWRYGEDSEVWDGTVAGQLKGQRNLGGTARTLDNVDGPVDLEPGVVSSSGLAVLDDSDSLALREDGWPLPRAGSAQDLYLFAHGSDAAGAVRDLYRLSGPPPLLPRYALGNWWSRYHRYSDAEYLELVERFEQEGVPLSVAVVDMDWHVTDVPAHLGSGWTGYTWNPELFPDPEGFAGRLHDHGLKLALNVHPADGIRAHEASYARVAEAMGIDPVTEAPVVFDIADRDFVTTYFRDVHHPLEDAGVDLWWLDWQQGGFSSVPGLDPLWMLNHLHYLDSARHGARPLTFSRYAGPGSHRYPIGFSGDTVISWESLAFQPFFTANAANIGYGWWSHDIGGHFFGAKDDELQTRWVQFGVFSPVMRLHSSSNPFGGKEPWNFGAGAAPQAEFLRLRHRMVPYLFSMNERAHREGIPLCTPLFWHDPDRAELYRDRPNTYMFGSELLVAPIVRPGDRELGVGSVRTYLPPGVWHDVFTGTVYDGGRRLTLHRPLEQYPVLAKGGAIVPLEAEAATTTALANPDVVELRVYAGADGELTLYEDDDAAEPRSARTRLTWEWEGGRFRIDPPEGDPDVLPERRTWVVSFVGLSHHGNVRITVEGRDVLSVDATRDEDTATSTVSVVDADISQGVVVEFESAPPSIVRNDVPARVRRFLERAQISFELKAQVQEAVEAEPTAGARIAALQSLQVEPALFLALSELILARREEVTFRPAGDA